MKKQRLVLIAIGSLALVAGCETPAPYGDVRVQGRDYDMRVVFSDTDRRIIRDYYRADVGRLPPGLAKKGKIPPGHAFKMQRQLGVPPQVNWEYLPRELETRLTRLPDGFVRVIIGADVGILNTRTRVVVDLLEDIND